MQRSDLLALTQDALGALANRGLVKRAAKEVSAGAGPTVEVDEDGTVRGRFADGVESALPVHVSMDAASCTCGAKGVCRHRIAVVLAYQQQQDETAPPFVRWSPGDLDDAVLCTALGDRVITAARRTHRAGYPVRLHRPTPENPAASAELPLCTVQFLVPGALGYVHTDAAATKRDEFVALAVWAFREADERGLTDDVVQFDAGGATEPDRADLRAVVELADQLLRDGAAHSSPSLDAALRRAQRELADSNLHWPAAAAADLADQLAAHRSRTAHYRAERLAELITELHARQRSTGARSQVLGSDEQAETPLRRVRLTALGCRVRGTTQDRTAAIYFASGPIVLVLRHRWELSDGAAPTGHDLASRRLSGSTLGKLAAANVVSESATRSASRAVRLSSSRVSTTSITPVGNTWESLPETIVVRDLAAACTSIAALPPRLIRPRVEAELVRVVEIADVHAIGYDPGAQRLDAVVADSSGTTATISATYSGICPAALDALANALQERPRFVSGSLRLLKGSLVIEPFAVQTDSGLIVPDLAPGTGDSPLAGQDRPDTNTIGSTVDAALAVCAEAAHRGLSHIPPGLCTRLDNTAHQLHRVGLHTTAALMSTFAQTTTVDSWVDVHIRLLTIAEFR